jgi:hypothetical protein
MGIPNLLESCRWPSVVHNGGRIEDRLKSPKIVGKLGHAPGWTFTKPPPRSQSITRGGLTDDL